MLKAFWTWDPVASGTYRAFDEPYAYQNNKWFFDKSVWQKMFRAMSGCGFDAMILANTHPFPFMADLAKFPEAKVIDDATLFEYQRMHRWIFETALDYDIAPYLLFFNVYFPANLLQARGIAPDEADKHTDLAIDYTAYCFRALLETYPEISGFVADVGESSPTFVQEGIINPLDAHRPDSALYLRGANGVLEELMECVKRRAGKSIRYCIPYTHEHLVDASPDSTFLGWTDRLEPEAILAEFAVSNFEPWTSFSYETVDGILGNLNDMDCHGFALQPLSIFEWPLASDTNFKYQFQRDLTWYSVWGGTSVDQMLRRGQPKWLLRNSRLAPGFAAGSRILELVSLYFAGDKSTGWRPQFCSVKSAENDEYHLFTVRDMLNTEQDPAFTGRNWWEDVTGDKVVHPAEYVKSGTPNDAYGPDELIEELADLSEQAVAAGEKGIRSASGEKELPSFSRDALCMGRLGEFYVERLRAALAHARGEDAEALEHMARALGLYRDVRALDRSHRNSFRIRIGRTAAQGDWTATVKALETEYEDARNGEFENEYRLNL